MNEEIKLRKKWDEKELSKEIQLMNKKCIVTCDTVTNIYFSGISVYRKKKFMLRKKSALFF